MIRLACIPTVDHDEPMDGRKQMSAHLEREDGRGQDHGGQDKRAKEIIGFFAWRCVGLELVRTRPA